MKALSWMLCVCAVVGTVAGVTGCEQTASAKVPVERLPDVKPSLPSVPTLPAAPYPVQFPDQSYSVYGLRRALRRTINTELSVTAYIAKVFIPEVCPPKSKCPLPPAPHMYLADSKTETDTAKMVIVAGYAENQKAIDDAIAAAKKGKPKKAPEDVEMLPIPTDFFHGAKVKLKGRFTFMSGAGFQSSEGVLDYVGHETLEPGVPPEDTGKKK
jgi:hypothetical protein